jgi:hypothetical protein
VKRLVIGGALAALIAGGAGMSFAGAPGPNGHNDYGLCKAYFAGSQNGQDHKHKAGPFAALAAAADDGDDNTSPAEDVAAYCEDVTPGGK